MSSLNIALRVVFYLLSAGTAGGMAIVLRRGMKGKKQESKSDAEKLFDLTSQ